jgi:hypothetical protein
MTDSDDSNPNPVANARHAKLRRVQEAIYYGSQTAKLVFRTVSIEEETITGAFAGAVAAHSAWLASGNPLSKDGLPFYFAHFKKGKVDKQSQIKEASGLLSDHEVRTGADFAIVIGVDDKHALLALFQAKKSYEDNGTPVFYLSGKKRNRVSGVREQEDQLQAMIGYSSRLETRLSIDRSIKPVLARTVTSMSIPSVTGLRWMHYLVYRDAGWLSVSLAAVVSAIGSLPPPKKGVRRTIPLNAVPHVELFDMFDPDLITWRRWHPTLGAALNSTRAPHATKNTRELRPSLDGWLTVDLASADAVFQTISADFSIYLLESRDGPFQLKLAQCMSPDVRAAPVTQHRPRRAKRPRPTT